MAAIETYRRLVVLAGELSDQLARIAPRRPAPRATPTADRRRLIVHFCLPSFPPDACLNLIGRQTKGGCVLDYPL